MHLLIKLALIAAAGAAGTLARYGLSGLVGRASSGAFPWGTFAVNAAGCFLFGLIWACAEERSIISAEQRTIILIGFMGAFTTFSTFMFETGELLGNSQWLLAGANLVGQNCVGVALLLAGLAAGRLVWAGV